LSYLADTQTDRQTNKVWQKHNLLAGGNITSRRAIILVMYKSCHKTSSTQRNGLRHNALYCPYTTTSICCGLVGRQVV